ncbi:MAG TPA: hypothetical protein VML50_10460 [Anaeromyxobacter sp.]|nr:hypothetical protein [Anaeromyxobacter sp.]
MIDHRETFYRCTLSSPAGRRVAHVRAWDPGEAVQLFQVELRDEGVEEGGTIEVAHLDGEISSRARYRPAAGRRPAR